MASLPTSQETALELLHKWRTSVAGIQGGHYKASKFKLNRHILLGYGPILISSAISVVSIASLLFLELTTIAKLLAGVLGALSAALSGVQTFRKFGDEAEQHKHTGVALGALLRLMDQTIAMPPDDMGPRMDEIRRQWDAIQKAAPMIPDRFFLVHKQEIELGTLPRQAT